MDFFAKPETSYWFCNDQSQQNDTDKIMDITPYDDFVNIDWANHFSYQSNKLFLNEFHDLENFNFDFNLPNLDENLEVEQKPTNVVFPELVHNTEKVESVCESAFSETSEKVGKGLMSFVKKEEEWENQDSPFGGNDFSFAESGFVETFAKHGNEFLNFVKKENEEFSIPLTLPSSNVIMKKKSSLLQFDEIKEHFDVPITMAAKKMNIGVTLLKRRCRELNINRWPHRKLKSLMLLIDNLKEMGLEDEVAMLEKEKKMLEEIPGMELNAEIKKLRQSFFKANYKKRRSNTFHP
ncbi:protein RKD2-like [Trifolium pratense]|uniref:Protein RKD2-like n=1 Tax=Trifolium pratense TaxID=57577 RepID=A0A2K3LB25_TRIPR|nr:protein RKD2-like [Trifolium pratense]